MKKKIWTFPKEKTINFNNKTKFRFDIIKELF